MEYRRLRPSSSEHIKISTPTYVRESVSSFPIRKNLYEGYSLDASNKPGILSNRLNHLESIVDLHHRDEKSRKDDIKKESNNEEDHTNCVLRQTLAMEEHRLELEHRDILLKRARDSIAKLQEENESLRQVANYEKELNEECIQLRSLRTHMTEEAKNMDLEIRALREQRDRLAHDYDQAQLEMQGLRSRYEWESEATQKYRELYENSAKELTKSHSQEAKYKFADERCEEMRLELEDKNRHLEDEKKQMAKLNVAFEQIKSSFDAERANNVTLIGERDMLLTNQKKLVARVQELCSRCLSLRECRIRLEGALQHCAANADREIADLNLNYMRACQQAEKATDEVAHLKSDIAKMTSCQKNLMQDLGIKKVQCNEMLETTSKCNILAKECSRLEGQLAILKEKEILNVEFLKTKNEQISALKTDISRAEATLKLELQLRKSLEMRCSSLEENSQFAQDKLQVSIAFYQQLRTVLSALLNQIEETCIQHIGKFNVNEDKDDNSYIGAKMLNKTISMAASVPKELASPSIETIQASVLCASRIIGRLKSSAHLKSYFSQTTFKIEQDMLKVIEKLEEECRTQQIRLQAAEQNIATVKGEMNVALKKAVSAERETANKRIEKAREETRALQAKFVATEGELAVLKTKSEHAALQAFEAQSQYQEALEVLQEQLQQSQKQVSMCASDKFKRAELVADIGELRLNADALEKRLLNVVKEKDKACLELAAMREIAETREIIRSSCEEFAKDGRFTYGLDAEELGGYDSDRNCTVAFIKQCSQLGPIVLDLKGLMHQTRLFFDAYSALCKGRQQDIKELDGHCLKLLECNAQLVHCVEALGLDYQRLRLRVEKNMKGNRDVSLADINQSQNYNQSDASVFKPEKLDSSYESSIRSSSKTAVPTFSHDRKFCRPITSLRQFSSGPLVPNRDLSGKSSSFIHMHQQNASLNDNSELTLDK